jgi:hypothetical protein
MAYVWMIEDGDYSDHHIIGVFSSEENARKMQDKTGGWIEKRFLDPGINALNDGLTPYRIQMDRDGNMLELEKEKIDERSLSDYPRVGRYPASCGSLIKVAVGTVFAKDESHAVKIMNEHRAQFIANGEL